MQAQTDSTSERNQFPLQKGEGGEERNVNALKSSKNRGGERKLGVVQFGSCDRLLLRLHKVTHSVKYPLPCLASCDKDMGVETSQMK